MSTQSYYELLEPGIVTQLGSHTFERQEVIDFATKYDPQPFHLDEKVAKNSLFGGLCASGWHTASVWMRLNSDNGRAALIEAIGYKGPPPVTSTSPGVRNVRWTHPVFVGDTIRYQNTTTDKRHLNSRPGWGMASSKAEGFNQDGKLVFSQEGSMLLRVD